MNIFRRQIIKLKLMKTVMDVTNHKCCFLTKTFNDTYSMVDNKYSFHNYSLNYNDVELSFDELSDDKLDKAEEMVKLF